MIKVDTTVYYNFCPGNFIIYENQGDEAGIVWFDKSKRLWRSRASNIDFKDCGLEPDELLKGLISFLTERCIKLLEDRPNSKGGERV